MLVEVAAVRSNRYGMLGKVKVCPFKRIFDFQHSIMCFLGPAGFGNDNAQGFIQTGANCSQNLIHAIRIGVVEEIRFELIGARIAQGVGYKLWSQRRPADPN